jgi:hypothetical protein
MRDLEQARREVLEAQRTCAICSQRCEDGWHLYLHITIKHRSMLEKAP